MPFVKTRIEKPFESDKVKEQMDTKKQLAVKVGYRYKSHILTFQGTISVDETYQTLKDLILYDFRTMFWVSGDDDVCTELANDESLKATLQIMKATPEGQRPDLYPCQKLIFVESKENPEFDYEMKSLISQVNSNPGI